WGPKPRPTHPPANQPIPPIHDLAIPTPRRQMSRIELSRESVEEIAPRLGRPVKDRHILPGEGNHPRPRAAFSHHGPRAVLACPDHTPEIPDSLRMPETSAHDRARATPAREFGGAGSTKRSTYQQDGEAFEKIRLALGIRASDQIEVRRRSEGKGVKIPEITEFYGVDAHPISTPMGTSDPHRHDNTERTVVFEA